MIGLCSLHLGLPFYKVVLVNGYAGCLVIIVFCSLLWDKCNDNNTISDKYIGLRYS